MLLTKKRLLKQDSIANIWCVYFYNPLMRSESKSFKRGIQKCLRNYNPIKKNFEELTAFLILSSEIQIENLFQNENETRKMDEGNLRLILNYAASMNLS